MNKIVILGCVLLVAALAIAGYQLHQLENRVAALQAQTEKLREIAERPPTQYVNTFPANMERITRLIAETKDKLTVVTDFCAYGHYSNPAGYKDYFSAIKKLADTNIAVEMYLYDDPTYKKATVSQLGTDFEILRNKTAFARYFEAHPNTPRPRSMKEFTALMDSEQGKCAQKLSEAGVRVSRTIGITLPIFMWVRDGDEAVFSMYNLGDRAREVSLVTRDKSLITLLDEIATQARQRRAETNTSNVIVERRPQ